MTKIIYLTIDDAPSADCANKLNYLDEHGIQAVWFAVGKYLEAYPSVAIDLIRRGHILANHSLTHPAFSEISLDQAYEEIARTDDLLNDLYRQAGVERRHRFFRFPFGDKGGDFNSGDADKPRTPAGLARYQAIQNCLRELDYTQPAFDDVTYRYYRQAGLLNDVDWYWTYDAHDWCPYSAHPRHGIDSVAKVLARLDDHVPEDWRGINNPDSADIVLIHDHVTPDNIFRQVLDKLRAKGVTFRLPVTP
jgi:peptidoglycan/xylan/chitin deacetylase (PgdA/CDA1 family)